MSEVAASVCDPFDPEEEAGDDTARNRAIDVLTTRYKRHGLAIDRILGLPDGSIATLTRAQVEAMVAALPRNY